MPSDTTALDNLDDGNIRHDKLPPTNYDYVTFGEDSVLGDPFRNSDKKSPYSNMQVHPEIQRRNFSKDLDDIFMRSRKHVSIRGVTR